MNLKRMVIPLAVCLLMACTLPLARAEIMYDFGCITANTETCSVLASQLSFTLSSPAVGQVLFTFANAGPMASSITDILFDDGSLLGIASVLNSTGVLFSQIPITGPQSTPQLPSGNTLSPPFVTTAGFGADPDPPTALNGVDPLEYVGILFDLLPGMTIDDTTAALASGDLRVGIHVQALDGGFSESMVNDPNTPTPDVPEPASILLLGAALLGISRPLRRRFFA